jgi:7-cyano-7-deazaguanine synthase
VKRSVVLLSSGLDSTVNLYEAREQSHVVAALTFNYGQRAALQEIKHARAICNEVDVRHIVVDVPFFSEFTRTALVNRESKVPVQDEVGIDDLGKSQQTAVRVWVPNRNGILLNIAAGYAEGLGADWIIPGFNIEEAATFPDNTDDFLKAATHAFSFSTSNKVEAKCFTTALDKTAIARRGQELGVRFDLIWPCYFGDERLCGQCESCQRFQRACRAAGISGLSEV